MNLKYVQIAALASVFALQFLAEHLYPQKKEINDWKNERFNLAIGSLNVLLNFIPASFFVQWVKFLQVKNLGVLHQFTLPFGVELIITILAMDFWMYV